MAWKFFSVAKANAEVDRLELELKNSQDALKVSQENVETLTKAGETVQAELTAAQGKITKLESDLTDAKAAVTDFETKVKTAASAKALEITSAQGIPPLSSAPNPNPQKAEKNTEGLKGSDRFIAEFESKNAHLISKK